MNRSCRVACVSIVTVVWASSAAAQLPNAPILQNVWANPGMVGAFNMGGGSGGSVYAGAASWTPSSGRFQLSGGLGIQSTTNGGGSNAAYGARVALPLGGSSASFGFAGFVGLGGGGAKRTVVDSVTRDTIVANATTTLIPVGGSVGWRKAIGTSHGFSLYATPSYVFLTGGGSNGGILRAAVGADVGITQSIGLTGGVEFGQTRSSLGGPSGTMYGLGVSYAFGTR
jgi:hypothetical protein